MNEKKAPQRGQVTIKIIIEYEGSCNAVAHFEAPTGAKQYTELELTKKGSSKPIVLHSPRLIEAFTWLQDKMGSVISVADLAEAINLDKDQTRKVLQTLSREKKLIHYSTVEGGKLKLIRVDDMSRMKPITNGVQDDPEQTC